MAWTRGKLHCSYVFVLKGNRLSILPLFSGVSADEKAEYDEGVDVYFESCAWIDSEINM